MQRALQRNKEGEILRLEMYGCLMNFDSDSSSARITIHINDHHLEMSKLNPSNSSWVKFHISSVCRNSKPHALWTQLSFFSTKVRELAKPNF